MFNRNILNIILFLLDSPWIDINTLKSLIVLLSQPKYGHLSIDKILQFVEYSSEIVEKVKEIASRESNSHHPFLVIATLNNLPFKFYVSLFDATFRFETFLGALDILFQSFFVLNLEYPVEIKAVYIFIQKFFYQIKLQTDSSISKVVALINKLDFTRL